MCSITWSRLPINTFCTSPRIHCE